MDKPYTVKSIMLDVSAEITISKAVSTAIALSDAYSRIDYWGNKQGPLVAFSFSRVNISVKFDSKPRLIVRDYYRAIDGCIDCCVVPYPKERLTRQERKADAQARTARRAAANA